MDKTGDFLKPPSFQSPQAESSDSNDPGLQISRSKSTERLCPSYLQIPHSSSAPGTPIQRRRANTQPETPSPLIVVSRESSDLGDSGSYVAYKGQRRMSGPDIIVHDSRRRELPSIPSPPVMKQGEYWKIPLKPVTRGLDSRRGSMQSQTSEDEEFQSFLKSPGSFLRRGSAPAPKVTRRSPTPPDAYNHRKDLPTICGFESVIAHPRQGIPAEHLISLALRLKSTKAIMGVRPFDRIATSMALSRKKSKSLPYKLKSSNWGPHAALMPLNQSLSKLAGSNKKDIAIFQAYADLLRREAVPLVITKDRLKELSELYFGRSDQAVLENMSWQDDGSVYFTARPEGFKDDYLYRGILQDNGEYLIEMKEGADYAPFQLIDLMPDYDLSFLYFPFETVDLGGEDKVPIPMVSHEVVQHRLQVYMEKGRRGSSGGESSASYAILEEGAASRKVFLKDMNQQYGNMTVREKQYLRTLNWAVKRHPDKNPLFHHGADNQNPVSDLKTNFPMTVIIPVSVGCLTETFYMVENKQQLKALLKELKDCKYYVPVNPLWEDVKGNYSAPLMILQG
ncbi:MAG: anthrax toxin-like adenylyl cyclase domain-containing protein [Endozoicomonas sp.]|uniref:anthrax toxin-like adenylyl cyclase domain-containing protein n=1 Tax=Endozoicomonas sp. TaxID=1892382 RepID=UPI003D9B2643